VFGRKEHELPIQDLATHPAYYVTVAELADYWAVSRRQIHKRIESGHLNAIRLGVRLYRIRTQAALDFERQATALSRAPKT
jgi:excisionase family DNA binding protein